MTTRSKNLANVLITILTSTGVISLCVYGFIAFGSITTKVENFEKSKMEMDRKLQNLDEKKADKDMVFEMKDDLKYIRTRLDEHMNKAK